MKEKTLWNRIQQDDNGALRELFDLYYGPLCSYVMQFTQQMSDAEDIVQNVFVNLWTKREKLTIRTSLKAYLYKSAYNSYIQIFREAKQKNEYLDSLKYRAMISYQLEKDNEFVLQKIERLKKMVDTLPDRCRQILLLSKREGYKNKEIAEELGISIKTVEAQLTIAFQKLREHFKNDNLFLFICHRILPKI